MHMKNAIHAGLLGLLALPLLVSCGDSGGASGDPTALTDGGYSSLNSGDYTGALGSFEQALAAIEPGAQGFTRAAMGEVEALIYVDATRAQEKFLQLATSFPDSIDARQYKTVGGKMTSEKKYVEAIAVLDAGLKAYGEDPDFPILIATVKEQASKAGDSDAMKALEGLGYL